MDGIELPGMIGLAFVAASTTAALATAIISLLQISSARKSHRSLVFLEMKTRYASPDITNAIYRLLAYQKGNEQDFAEKRYAAFVAKEEWALALDHDRRILLTWFVDLLALFEMKVLGKTESRHLTGGYGATVLKHIVLPLGQPFYGTTDDTLRRLRKISPDFGGQGL